MDLTLNSKSNISITNMLNVHREHGRKNAKYNMEGNMLKSKIKIVKIYIKNGARVIAHRVIKLSCMWLTQAQSPAPHMVPCALAGMTQNAKKKNKRIWHFKDACV